MSSDPVIVQMDAVQAELDELRAIYTSEHPPPEPVPEVIRIKPGDDADAAFKQCLSESKSLAAAPGEYLVNWKVPDDYNGYVVVTTDTDQRLAPGTRIDRDAIADLAVFRAKQTQEPVLRYGLRSTGVHLAQVGIGPQYFDKTVITMGTDTMTRPEDQPHDISFSHLLACGDPVRGQHRAIMMGVRNFSLTDSSFYDYHEEGRDSQVLAVWNGGQGILVRNCFLEGGAENVLIGGGNALNVDMLPSDHRYERCIISKNPAWWSGMQYKPQVKCLFEAKFIKRLLITGCLFEHSRTPAAAMDGCAIVIKVCSNATGDEWITTEDVTLEHSVVRKVGRFVGIVGSNDSNKPTQQMRRLRINNVLGYEMDTAEWPGGGDSFTTANLPKEMDLSHLTLLGCDHGLLMMSFGTQANCRADQMALRDSVAYHGMYGIKSPAGMGLDALNGDIGAGKYLVSGNALKKHPDRTNKLPANNLVLQDDPFWASLDPETYEVLPGSPAAAVVTTDGTLPGIHWPQLKAHNPYTRR